MVNKSWIKSKNRCSTEYIQGVKCFMNVARNHMDSLSQTRCPCRSCLNVLFQPIDDVEEHLFVQGFDSTYIKWIHHGDNRLESMNKDVNDKPSTKDSLQKTSVQICFDLISDESSSVDVAAVENMTLLEETVEEHGRILAAMQSQLAHITSWLQHFRSRQKPSQDTPSCIFIC
ncbi:hypothetical protein AAG906_009298 [Vitis piasezkii]